MLYYKTDFQVHLLDWGVLWSRASCLLTVTHAARSVQIQQDVLWVPSISDHKEIATQLLAGCNLSYCIFKNIPFSLSYLQHLVHQKHSSCWLAHRPSTHTPDATYLSFYACVGYSVFMRHSAESIWALQLHQQQQRVYARKHVCMYWCWQK